MQLPEVTEHDVTYRYPEDAVTTRTLIYKSVKFRLRR